MSSDDWQIWLILILLFATCMLYHTIKIPLHQYRQYKALLFYDTHSIIIIICNDSNNNEFLISTTLTTHISLDKVAVCILFLTLIVWLDTMLNSPPFQPIFIIEHSAVSCQTSCSSNGSTINLLWHLINSQQTPIPTDRFWWL